MFCSATDDWTTPRKTYVSSKTAIWIEGQESASRRGHLASAGGWELQWASTNLYILNKRRSVITTQNHTADWVLPRKDRRRISVTPSALGSLLIYGRAVLASVGASMVWVNCFVYKMTTLSGFTITLLLSFCTWWHAPRTTEIGYTNTCSWFFICAKLYACLKPFPVWHVLFIASFRSKQCVYFSTASGYALVPGLLGFRQETSWLFVTSQSSW